MGVKVTNNAFGTLSAGINTSDTTITLDSGQGARFPTLGAGDYFYGTIVDTSNNLEIVKVTARSTDSMTVTRAQDNTTATAFAIGDRFELRPVAALFEDIADGAELVNDTTPQLGGDLDANGHDILIDDGDYLKLGGSGLTLRTNAGNAYIVENTAGKLSIQGQNIELANSAGTSTLAYFVNGGAAQFYYNNSEKLATTSTGIDVTGRLDFDGVNGDVQTRDTHSGTAVGPNMPVFGRYDIRDPEPQAHAVNGYCRFGFTSYNLNNTATYADSFIMNSYTDASGGAPNMFLVNKNGSGVKISRGGYNSTSNFKNGTIYTLDYTSASDERVKENVQNITGGLANILALRPVTYEWTDEYIREGHSKNSNENQYTQAEGEAPVVTIPETKTTNVGFIAQEVEEVIPTVVHQDNVRLSSMEEGDYLKDISYEKLVPHLVAALKEQQTVIDDLKARVEALENG
jgi:hypothetical protein